MAHRRIGGFEPMTFESGIQHLKGELRSKTFFCLFSINYLRKDREIIFFVKITFYDPKLVP